MHSILNGCLCPPPLVSDHHFPNLIFSFSGREREGKGGGIHKRHLVFDLIKVEELATQVYLLVDGYKALAQCFFAARFQDI